MSVASSTPTRQTPLEAVRSKRAAVAQAVPLPLGPTPTVTVSHVPNPTLRAELETLIRHGWAGES